MKPELNSIKSVYENAHTPFLLCGKSLDIIWANAAAYEVFPAFKTPSGLKLYLPEQTLSEIKGITTAAQIKLWDININLLVQKMEDEFSLTFIPNEKEMLSEKILSSLISSIPHCTRYSLAEIFSSVGTISRIAEENENERLYDISKSINLNCYKLLRSNNLISSYCREMDPTAQEGEIINLSDLMKNICDASRVITNDLGIPLIYNCERQDILVKANELSLTEAIISIIDNCCKYSKDKSEITVKLSLTGKSAVIIIKDNGMGIPGDVLPYIFKPYYSFSRDNFPFSGVGLGLTVARLVTLRWGGNISVSSKDYEGTTVLLTLPICEDSENLTFNSKVSISDLLRDRFSTLHIIMSDNDKVPLP